MVQSTLTTVDHCQTSAGDARHDRPQQFDRIGIAPTLVGVGKVLADIPNARGAEQRVDHGVRQHVGV
jgi:hypothetical protein